MKNKAFTLVELISVLVILSIIVLITVPLVIGIKNRVTKSADRRSVDAYGKSIELAISTYLLDQGSFPTKISDLEIEYTGDEVICAVTKFNDDYSVLLEGCKVNGRSTGNYTYGKNRNKNYRSYSIGDEIVYNNVEYYVIADSGNREENVILLKKTPLTVAEVNQYGGVGTENNYVDKNNSSQGTAYDLNGYGGMAYYSSATCTYSKKTGCTAAYEYSDIKHVVDAWSESNVPSGLIEARLITINDLVDNLGMEFSTYDATQMRLVTSEDTPTWVFGENYYYWTSNINSNIYNDYGIWYINSLSEANLKATSIVNDGYVVRPVIVVSKSSI